MGAIIPLMIGSNAMTRASAGLQWFGLGALLVQWHWGPALDGDVVWWLYVAGAVALMAGILLIFACEEGAGPLFVGAGVIGITATAAFLLVVQVAVVVARYARRHLIALGLVGTLSLVAGVAGAAAQTTDKPRVIGVLSLSAGPTLRDEIFERRLRELGWSAGQNVRLEYRRAGNAVDRLAALAGELVRMKPDVLVAQATPAVKALKDATTTIPIVSISADPVANGFVASLARPGGNITGVSMMMPELAGKGLELLREIVPKLSRVAYLAHPDDPSHRFFLKETTDAGRRLGIAVQPVMARGSKEFDAAFAAMKRERAGAVIVQPLFVNTMGHGGQLAELAARQQLPAISSADNFADLGGLMVHAPDPLTTYQRVATYVDQVLRGANPAELPIEQPQTFAMTLNMKTAKRLGVRVPPSLRLRADHVIE